MKKLSGITFDFDATFYNYPKMVMKLIHRYGIHLKLISDLTKARAELRKEGFIKNFRERQAEFLAEKWGKPVDWTRKKIDRVVYDGWNSSFDKIKPEKGTFETLDMVVANGIPIAVVSDYPPHDKMQKMGFMKYPWVLVLNCESIGLLKPHPKGYQMAMKAMGTVPKETLHVGDSLKYDIRGAKNLGLMTGWIKRFWKKKKIDIQPDYTFSNFFQLMDILEKEFGLKK